MLCREAWVSKDSAGAGGKTCSFCLFLERCSVRWSWPRYAEGGGGGLLQQQFGAQWLAPGFLSKKLER
jgi:hypothetical protein